MCIRDRGGAVHAPGDPAADLLRRLARPGGADAGRVAVAGQYPAAALRAGSAEQGKPDRHSMVRQLHQNRHDCDAHGAIRCPCLWLAHLAKNDQRLIWGMDGHSDQYGRPCYLQRDRGPFGAIAAHSGRRDELDGLRLMCTSSQVGIAVMAIIVSAYGAAAVKSSTSPLVVIHNSIASVCDPVGRRSNVIVSSLATLSMTSMAPAMTPGNASGSVTERKVAIGLRPNVLAIRSYCTDACPMPTRWAPTAIGR